MSLPRLDDLEINFSYYFSNYVILLETIIDDKGSKL